MSREEENAKSGRMDRREFASIAGVAALATTLPFPLSAALSRAGANTSAEIVSMEESSLPGGGRRDVTTMSFDIPGQFKGRTTIIQDEWPMENGRVVECHWHSNPTMKSFDGLQFDQFRVRAESTFGRRIDDEFHEVTTKLAVRIPGPPPYVATSTAQRRINFKYSDTVREQLRESLAAINRGTDWQDALRENTEGFGNVTPLSGSDGSR